MNGKDEAIEAACVCVSAELSDAWLYIHIECTHVPLEDTSLWSWPRGAATVSSIMAYQMQQLLILDLPRLVLLYYLSA